MQHYVYVQDVSGKPLMPTTRYGKVRRMLKDGRAEVVTRLPFTIRLLYEPETKVIQPIRLGEDPGRKNIGVSAVREDGKCLYRSHVETRNENIPELMGERKEHRGASRRGERLARKRLAERNDTTTEFPEGRMLPGCEKPLELKDIINTEARFNNRKRPEGWLTPTANQLLETHENIVDLVCKILPVTFFSYETNKFDFVKMEGKKVGRWQYGAGPLSGHGSIRDALTAMQGGKCLLCGENPIAHDHHIVPRSRGGSDILANMAGVCESCHQLLHNSTEAVKKLSDLKHGMNKKYHHLSVLNQIIGDLGEWAGDRFADNAFAVEGYSTRKYREDHKLEKDHDVDAYAIAAMTWPEADSDTDMPPCYEIRQFRRRDRALIKAQVFRSYYLVVNGKEVKAAQNRKPAYEAYVAKDGTVKQKKQSFPALSEWFEEQVGKVGIKEAERLRSSLIVKKSFRRYNDKERVLPGAEFWYRGERYVKTGQLTGGDYVRAYGQGTRNFPARDCVFSGNKGLVYVS